MPNLFDPNPGHRTEADWRDLLSELVSSLSQFSGIKFVPTSWYTRDDEPGHASSSNCVNIRGVVNATLRLEACGVVCISINFGEAVWASADLLLFSGGQRLIVPGGLEVVAMVYRLEGWSSHGWVTDAYGEWESHDTDARWQDADPDSPPECGST